MLSISHKLSSMCLKAFCLDYDGWWSMIVFVFSIKMVLILVSELVQKLFFFNLTVFSLT